MIDVLLVTTWDTACGIAEHSAMLKEAVEPHGLTIAPLPEALDPAAYTWQWSADRPIIHLNYHAALHSQWTPGEVRRLQRAGYKIVITYHDTGVPNSEQCKGLYEVADAFVVHEPAEDLPGAYYWRMGVPALDSLQPFVPPYGGIKRAYLDQPLLGTVGFPFGWKCYDELAKVTAKVGWALLLLAPNATDEQIATWQRINPSTTVVTSFTQRDAVVRILHACDATAFTYVCHNTGQSGAILQGIAARKPVIALKTCRQMRALFLDRLGNLCINWAETFEDVAEQLRYLPIQRVSPAMVALAEQESWTRLGAKYADLYKGLR